MGAPSTIRHSTVKWRLAMDRLATFSSVFCPPRSWGSLSRLPSQTGFGSGAFMGSPMCRGATMPDSWTIRPSSIGFCRRQRSQRWRWIATAAETLFGLLSFSVGGLRLVALLSGALLTVFGLAMTVALGVKAPRNLSVFSAAGGALLLAEHADVPFSVDELLRRNRQEK